MNFELLKKIYSQPSPWTKVYQAQEDLVNNKYLRGRIEIISQGRDPTHPCSRARVATQCGLLPNRLCHCFPINGPK